MDATYYGGGALNCYFTGEFAEGNGYFGSIVGVCGANIYESNSYSFNGVEYFNFKDNCYSVGSAFGALANIDGDKNESFISPVEDKGAQALTREEIEKSKGFIEILAKLDS